LSISLCLGDPLLIPDEKDKQGKERALDERVRELHQSYISAMQALFNVDIIGNSIGAKIAS
jgi:hypothetical protein